MNSTIHGLELEVQASMSRDLFDAFEFFIAIDELTTNPAVRRATARATSRPE